MNKQVIISDKKKKKKLRSLTLHNNSLTNSTFQSADLAISKMLSSDVDPEKLEKLLEVKGKYEAEENKKAFQIAFSNLQSDLPVIQKTKEVWNREKTYILYKYAPLEKIVQQVQPILKKYNFSFRWSEGLTEKENYKRIYCHIMACGHEEISFCDIPIMDSNKVINDAQQAGVSSTYGKRYSFIGALGIMADEDTDGQTPKPKAEVIPTPKNQTVEELRKEFRDSYAYYVKLNRKPPQKLTEFCNALDMMESAEIRSGINGLNDSIKKAGGKK